MGDNPEEVVKPVAITAEAVIQFFAQQCLNRGETLDATKLTLLSYYAYAWYLYETENKASLFEDRIVAAPLGPRPLRAAEYAEWLVEAVKYEEYSTLVRSAVEEAGGEFVEDVPAEWQGLLVGLPPEEYLQ